MSADEPSPDVDQIIERFRDATGVLQSVVHANARDMGYYDILDRVVVDDDSHAYAVISLLALVHSEVTEALREVRSSAAPINPAPADGRFAEELADVVLRVMDLAAFTGVDLGQAVEAKIRASRSRGRLADRRF